MIYNMITSGGGKLILNGEKTLFKEMNIKVEDSISLSPMFSLALSKSTISNIKKYAIDNNNTLYIIDNTSLYKFNGTSWEKVVDTPKSFGIDTLTFFDKENRFNALLATGSKHFRLNKDNQWQEISFEFNISGNDRVDKDNNGNVYLANGQGYIYKFDNVSWQQIGNIAKSQCGYNIACDNKSNIYALRYSRDNGLELYKYQDGTFRKVDTQKLPTYTTPRLIFLFDTFYIIVNNGYCPIDNDIIGEYKKYFGEIIIEDRFIIKNQIYINNDKSLAINLPSGSQYSLAAFTRPTILQITKF